MEVDPADSEHGLAAPRSNRAWGLPVMKTRAVEAFIHHLQSNLSAASNPEILERIAEAFRRQETGTEVPNEAKPPGPD